MLRSDLVCLKCSVISDSLCLCLVFTGSSSLVQGDMQIIRAVMQIILAVVIKWLKVTTR